MKKFIFFSVIVLLVFINWCCSKKESTCLDYSNKEKNKIYQYNFGPFGDEEGAMIIEQAKHFKISEFGENREKYKYQPKDNFIGLDSVKIRIRRGSDGASYGCKTIYKIKFNITECGMKVSNNIINN